MSDIPYIQQAQEIKITGQDSTGNTVNYVNADSNGNLSVVSRGTYSTLTNRSGTVSTTSAQIAPSNINRKYLFIQNLDAKISIFINFTSAATTGSGSIEITAGGAFVMEDNFISTEIVNAISASGTVSYTAKEG